MNALLIGKLVKPYGLKGLIKAAFYVDDLKELNYFSRFYIVNKKEKSGFQEIVFEKILWMQGTNIVKIEGCTNRNASELFGNKEIFVDEEELPLLKKDIFYIKDLYDDVVVEDDEQIGIVLNVLTVAKRSLLIVKRQNGREIAVPFNDKYIVKVDVNEKTVYVRNLAELF